MIGDSPDSDTALLDNLLSEAISRTYKRCAIRHSNPIPTFNDLREELQQWRDEERIERTVDEAKLAALKLREWTGEKGVYSKLFDQHTTLKTDADWLFFNVERLSDDPRLETAMSMMIAHAMQERASGRSGQHSITVLDECWSLLDSNVLAPEVVQLFRTARKRGGSVWGISQTLEDFVGTDTQPRIHGPGIVRNVSTKIIGRQPGDVSPLATHLALNQVALNEIKQLRSAPEGTERRSAAGDWREGGDHADDPARANASRVLGVHDFSARTRLSNVLLRQESDSASAGSVRGTGSEFPERTRGRAAASRRAVGCGDWCDRTEVRRNDFMKLLSLFFTNLLAFFLVTRVRRVVALTLVGAVALTVVAPPAKAQLGIPAVIAAAAQVVATDQQRHWATA